MPEEEKKEEIEKKEEKKEGKPGVPKFLITLIMWIAAAIIAAAIGYVAAKKATKPPEGTIQEIEHQTKITKEKEERPPPYVTYEVGDFSAKLIVPEDPYAERYIKLEGVKLAFYLKKEEGKEKKKEGKKEEGKEKKEEELMKDPLYAEIKHRHSQIEDIIDTLIKAQVADEICSKEGKEMLKSQIKEKINKILINGKIEDVFFKMIY